jgi:cell division protein FtsI/penicillin-binding protein 2
MKKLERRAILCLVLAVGLTFGLCVYCFRYVRDGGTWATFYANQHIYTNGKLNRGRIYDRNGVLLASNGKGEGGSPLYSSDEMVRRATAHAVGDINGNVSTSAEAVFKDKIVGYNLLTGTYDTAGRGNSFRLSIDSRFCKSAYEALSGYNGLAGVYNYETGEIVCMVSTPTFDPAYPPDVSTVESGTFLNKFLKGRFVPGSVFKILTTTAAVETLDEDYLKKFKFHCTGTTDIYGEKIVCSRAHGDVDFKGALSQSCNGAYAVLTRKVGAKKMEKYTKKCGLMTAYDMDGVTNTKGIYEFPKAPLNLAWAGIGQWKDVTNPCSFLVFLGAIANDGVSVQPRLMYTPINGGISTNRMMSKKTAKQVRSMLRNDVTSHYGQDNFPGLKIYAKTGTAEVAGSQPNAWFAGFIKNKNCPYAFVVCLQDAGYGLRLAAPVANRMMQQIVAYEKEDHK